MSEKCVKVSEIYVKMSEICYQITLVHICANINGLMELCWSSFLSMKALVVDTASATGVTKHVA